MTTKEEAIQSAEWLLPCSGPCRPEPGVHVHANKQLNKIQEVLRGSALPERIGTGGGCTSILWRRGNLRPPIPSSPLHS